VIAGFGASAVLAMLFVAQEARAPQPMLPLALFRNRLFALTSLVGLLVNIAFYGLIFVFSLYFQRVNGLSPFATGLAFLPMLGLVLPVNLVAARVAERIGAPSAIALGAGLSAAGCLALLGIAPGTGYWAIGGQLAIVGGGLGLLVPPLTSTLLGSVEKPRSGIAAGVLNATRQTGSVLGVALFGSLAGAPGAFMTGMHASLIISACLLLAAAAAIWRGSATEGCRRPVVAAAARTHALRSAKCAPQKAITAPRNSAASPASTPDMVGIGLGAEAAWPAAASTSTPTAIRNWRIRCGICPDTALSIRVAVK
jgi:DHA2 family methylenomycin A resistance protein-like MFS transporter